MTAGFGANFKSLRIRKRGTSPYVVEPREAPKGSFLSKTSAGLEVATHLSYVFIKIER